MTEPKIKAIKAGSVRIGRPAPQAGSWLSARPQPKMSARERLGYGFQTATNYPTGASFYSTQRNLMPAQLWKLYANTPDVRACVDSIARRIATWDWNIKVQSDPRNIEEYERLAKKAAEITKWLENPNANGETWQELMGRTIIDLLVYEAGVWELNMDGIKLKELVPWLGSEWFPVYNEKNVLLYYRQEKEEGPVLPAGYEETVIKLPPERVCYFSLFRNNREPLGMPLLNTLVNQCITVLLASEHAMLALDADEIPPGLLVLGGIGGAAAERARADLQQMKGKDQKIRVLSSPQPSGIEAKWVELRHSIKDVQLLEVVDEMRRAIWRVFGVMPIELGVSDEQPRASASVQLDVSSSHLITPILELFQARVNSQIIPHLAGSDSDLLKFEFDRTQPLTPEQRLQLARSQDLQVRRGIITVNEARSNLDLLPVPGGDVALMDTNEGPRTLEYIVNTASAPLDEPPPDDEPDEPDEPDDPDDPPDNDGDPTPVEEKALSDQSAAVQKTLKKKAADHNDHVTSNNMADWRKTTASTLSSVYDRGMGAYQTNPQSVRPNVTSPQQWAYARVNSFLYALLNDKFRGGPHDTDLLPKQHPKSTKKKSNEINRGPKCRQPSETYDQCVSRKVPELLDEGYEQKQAVAIASSMCEVDCEAQQSARDHTCGGCSDHNEERVAAKYSHINFKPTKGVVAELKKGLKWHEEGHSGDGLVEATVTWARRMANGSDISPEKARKMRAWLARHAVDKEGKGFYPDQEGFPSPGRVAWALWGGDPAVGWSNKLVKQLDAADKAAKKSRGQEILAGRSMLPSAWPNADKYDSYRTINLDELADVVEEYAGVTANLYRSTMIEVMMETVQAYGASSTLSIESAANLKAKISDRLTKLAVDWQSATAPLYEEAAKIGTDSADKIGGKSSVTEYRAEAKAYQNQAMEYLNDPKGLIGTLRQSINDIVDAASMQGRDRADEVGPDSSMSDVTSLIGGEFEAQAYRIDNWSGKLVGLGSIALVGALLSTSDGTIWYYEWANVGGKMCATCIAEGSNGFRKVSDMVVKPAEDTLCGGRCRCTLIYWTEAEVLSGDAVPISYSAIVNSLS